MATNTPEWRPLSASEFERLTRFVRILAEWDQRRRTMDAVPGVTKGANGDDISGNLEPSRVVRESLDQGPEALEILESQAIEVTQDSLGVGPMRGDNRDTSCTHNIERRRH